MLDKGLSFQLNNGYILQVVIVSNLPLYCHLGTSNQTSKYFVVWTSQPNCEFVSSFTIITRYVLSSYQNLHCLWLIYSYSWHIPPLYLKIPYYAVTTSKTRLYADSNRQAGSSVKFDCSCGSF